MRQGQQNRRGRGRNNNNNNNNNNRKGQNPLARSFESNGPDVKIRGTPSHVAEKYMSLARDALSSGDPVLAENYFQHAEHYNRIIMAYREQQVQQGDGGGMGQRPRGPGVGEPIGPDDDMGSEDGDDLGPGAGPGDQPAPMQTRSQSEQHHRGYDQQSQGYDRPDRQERHPRHERPERHEQRHERHNRPRHDDQGGRPGGEEGGGYRPHQSRFRERRPYPGSEPQPNDAVAADAPPPAPQQPNPGGNRQGRMPRRERFAQGGGGAPDPGHEQPDFLRRPIRRLRRDNNGAGTDEGSGGVDAGPTGESDGEPHIDKTRL